MTEFIFNFDHPIKGRAYFIPLTCFGGVVHSYDVNTQDAHQLIIPVGHLNHGLWKLELDWVSDNRTFSLFREFSIDKRDPLNV